MMSDAGYGYPNGYGSNGGSIHYQDMNGDGGGHGHQLLSAYHENGRVHHPQPFSHLQYGPNQPYPRYPASSFDRISSSSTSHHHDVKPLHEGTNAPPTLDASQYPGYGCPTVPTVNVTHQPPPHQVPPPAQPLPYDTNCGPNRPSLSPHESHQQQQPPSSQQQYSSCKMLQHTVSPTALHHPLSNDMSPVHGQPISPPPPSHMYHHNGPPGSHSPNRSESQSFLYPWMKSQFGESYLFFSLSLHSSFAPINFHRYSQFDSLRSATWKKARGREREREEKEKVLGSGFVANLFHREDEKMKRSESEV